MFRDLRKVAPWFAIFVLAVVVGLIANSIFAWAPVGAPFWGLSCERADAVPLRPVSLKPVALGPGN